MTFNAKNLQYEKQEPAFLRRLRSENTSDRHHVSVARPRKPRLDMGDDDGPTIVDEQGENWTEQEYQDLLKGKSKHEAPRKDMSPLARQDSEAEMIDSLPGGTDDETKKLERPNVSINPGSKKRKQIKVVGAGSEFDSLPARDGLSEPHSTAESRPKMKPKKRKIKLSFDEPGT